MSVQLLSNEDIYDVYGCQDLLHKEISTFEFSKVKMRVREVRDLYVNSMKARIRSEAKFVGIKDLDDLSISSMLAKVREFIGKDIQKNMMGGGPVNLMASILKGHQMAGMDTSDINLGAYGMKVKKIEKQKGPEVDPNWFTSKDKGGECMFDDPKWAVIAKAFLDIEQATEEKDICVKIDILNALQHNSFHVLIDLQTGRMLEGQSAGDNYGKHDVARANLQAVLEMAKNQKEPADFASHMSGDIKALVLKHRNTPVKRIPAFMESK